MAVTKAIVLAAGLGTRLRPLTAATPKPLLPVWGEPMLARLVAELRARGVTDIVVNCHYLHEQVEAWCAANGCRASYEPEILGTGGVLNPLREWIGADPFYLVNGDIVIENAPALELSDPQCLGACLVSQEGPRTIEVIPGDDLVSNWKSDDPGWDGTFTYCGFALLSAEILKYVEPTGFSSIVSAYEKAMMDGRFMKAVSSGQMLWTDAGSIASYIDLNRADDENAFDSIPQVQAALAAFAQRVGATDPKVEFIGARGSDRAFFRLGAGAPRRDAMAVVYDDAKRGENARYAGHARWLKSHGIPVPDVVEDLPELKTTVFDWGGATRAMSLEESVKVVETLVRFNALASAPDLPELEPQFDAGVWKWERDLFAEHCLGTRFSMEMPQPVLMELERVAALLEDEPKALVHRDFQSTNVLWKNGALSVIDFQGMRLGPAAYDLASYVYDPYVTFTEGERRALVALYAKKAEREALANILPFAAVQRLVQCLGAYGRLASVGQPQFGRHVLPALENLLDAADRAGLDAVGALAEDLIARERASHEHEHGACGCHDHGHGHDHCHCHCHGHDHS